MSIGIVVTAVVALAIAAGVVRRSEAKVNKVALASAPKPVSVVTAKAAAFRRSRAYVGTLRPWVEANVGPQLVAAYVDTVLVRPGAVVKRGDVLATLDCRSSSATSNAVAMQAHAIEARQKAVADEANRTQKLLDRGYASANETEQVLAQSAAESAQLQAQNATLARSTIEVGDCVLRAPFDGEVGDRYADPGSFVRPGTSIVSVLDRSTVRFVADVPEVDFAVVAPTTNVVLRADAVGLDLEGAIVRRAPHADPETRTVRFEVDLPNHDRAVPVDTTAEATIAYGDPIDVTEIPLYAATVRSGHATVFVVDGDIVHARTANVLGERGGSLFIERKVAPGSAVVTEGRALLVDGDRIAAKVVQP